MNKQESEQIKKQLLKQAENLPDENKEQIKDYISGLDEKGLEEFLKKQNIQTQQENSQCIFCSIIQNKTSSYKIDENSKAIAILEINPLSKAHSLILPKEHISIEKLPNSVLALAKKIAKKIKTKFKPEDVKIETSSFNNHAFVNIIPIYKNEKLEKKQASEKELISIQNKLKIKTRTKRKPIKKENNLQEIGFRIP